MLYLCNGKNIDSIGVIGNNTVKLSIRIFFQCHSLQKDYVASVNIV